MPLPAQPQHLHVEEIDSTNSHLRRLLAAGAAGVGTLVSASVQTGGRGQQGRVWESARGQNMLCSLLAQPGALLPDRLPLLGKVVPVALLGGLRALLGPGAELHIKWPNDLLLEGRKLAGILIENLWEGAQLRGSIIGIGLNVNQTAFSVGIAHRAVSLRMATGRAWDVAGVQAALMGGLRQALAPAALTEAALAGPLATYDSALFAKGQLRHYNIGGQLLPATLLGVNADGQALLRTEAGTQALSAGELGWVWASAAEPAAG